MPPDDLDNRLHEPWPTRPQLAEHLAVSDGWIEMQHRVGLLHTRTRPQRRRTSGYIANDRTFASVRLYAYPLRLSSGILNLIGRVSRPGAANGLALCHKA